jgi:hypothetical protein
MGRKKSIKHYFIGKVKFKYRDKFFFLIENANLFRYNIFNYIDLLFNDNPDFELKKDDLIIIFDVLKYGDNFEDKNNIFFQFYDKVYRNFYFNPNGGLIDSTYMDQIMKNNINVIFSAIINNIKYNFDKYLARFIKTKFEIIFREDLIYNSLIKKCSTYEMYNNSKYYNRMKDYATILMIDKTYFNKKNFDKKMLLCLASLLDEKLKSFKIVRTEKNIFLNELNRVKDFEKTFNSQKSLIKQIITGQKDKSCLSELDKKFLDLYNDVLKIFPKEIIHENYYEKLDKNPFKFVKSMIKINKFLEQNKAKTFNVFPKSNNLIQKHITFDTTSLNVAFLNNKKYTGSVEDNKEFIYSSIFNFKNKIFTLNNGYKFSGTIQTDGVSLTLVYDKNEDVEKKLIINKAKADGRRLLNENKEKIKNNIMKDYYNILEYLKMYKLSLEDLIKKLKVNIKKEKNVNKIKNIELEIIDLEISINEIDISIKEINEEIKEKINNAIKKFIKEREEDKNEKTKMKNENNKLKCANAKKERKELMQKLQNENKEDELKIIEREKKEFYYIEDLTEKELKDLEKEPKIYFDLGKSRLFYALHKVEENGEIKDKFMKYSGKERGKGLRTTEHKNKIEKINKSLGVNKVNEKLKELNTKSSINLKENLKIINEENVKIYEKYKDKRLRKEKLLMYIDKQKTEKLMINKIVEQYNLKNINELKKIVAIVGDWKGNNKLKNNESTLGIGMKRMLSKYFKKIYLVDERNTSKLNHITHEEMKNLNLELSSKTKRGENKIINKKMHEILTLKMDKRHISKQLYNDEKEEKQVIEEKGKKIIIPIVRRFIQRDKNAVLNFEFLVDYYLKNKSRPEKFSIKKHNASK